jgi:hypothetical protein
MRMVKREARYDLAILEQALLAHMFETKALLNVLERKGLVTVPEVGEEIRRLKEQAAKGANGRVGHAGSNNPRHVGRPGASV